jgi:hypothetical protein
MDTTMIEMVNPYILARNCHNPLAEAQLKRLLKQQINSLTKVNLLGHQNHGEAQVTHFTGRSCGEGHKR